MTRLPPSLFMPLSWTITCGDFLVSVRSRSARTDFVLDALEQALCDRRPVRQGGLVTIATAAVNMSAFAIPNDWRKPGSNPPSAASTTAMTMRLQRPSTACSKPNRSIAAARGAAQRPWNLRPSSGSIGSRIDACSSRLKTSRPPRPKRDTMRKPMSTPSRRHSNQTAPDKPGAVHSWL
jgi:hypothetical protein